MSGPSNEPSGGPSGPIHAPRGADALRAPVLRAPVLRAPFLCASVVRAPVLGAPVLGGTVASFEEEVGLGTIQLDAAAGAVAPGSLDTAQLERRSAQTRREPAETVAFHCTAIADGSRRIDVGIEVSFVLTARHGGRLEASGIAPRR